MADPSPSLALHQRHVAADGGYSGNVVYVKEENGQGTVELTICTGCHYIFAKCEHITNTWDQAGEHLTCNLCGIDGT